VNIESVVGIIYDETATDKKSAANAALNA